MVLEKKKREQKLKTDVLASCNTFTPSWLTILLNSAFTCKPLCLKH